MTATTSLICTAIAAYFAGSIPFGLVIARFVAGVDLRKMGSGNIGATNVGRMIGKKWGILCLILDALKGLLPVWLLPGVFQTSEIPMSHLQVAAAIATVIGHMFPCWLGFRGGKGVATGLGVATMLSPGGMLAALGVFIVTFAASRVVSLGSIFASITFAVFELWRLTPEWLSAENWPMTLFSLAVPILIVVRHRQNIARLLRGEESTFDLRHTDLRNASENRNPASPPDMGEKASGEEKRGS